MSAFVDIYTSLWNHAFGLDRYARRKDAPGQKVLFGDEPEGGETQASPELPFGKGKGEPLFTEQRPPMQPDKDGYIVVDGRRKHVEDYARGARDAYLDTLAMRGPEHRITKGAHASMEEAEKIRAQHKRGLTSPSSWSATAFQGTGRDDQAGIYKHGPGAVFQDADYFAFSPEDARRYGPDVQEHQVELQNPHHVTNDLEWRDLTQAAGVNAQLNMGSQNPELIRQAADRLAAHLRQQGHDGLVISTAKTRWPRNIFGHDQIIRFREPQTGLAAASSNTPAAGKRGLPPNHVVAEVRDMDGQLLGYEHEPHDGTPDGIRAANQTLRDRLEDIHPTWSNIATRTGATDASGHPAWAVSPNSRNMYPTGSREAKDLLGWAAATQQKLK